MPSKNVVKVDVHESYYHVYARGGNKESVFPSEADYAYFYKLLARYLAPESSKSKNGVVYPHYRKQIELLSYCLMGNHFHLLLYQHEQGVMSKLMKSIMTSYTAYFNRKYKRSGSLFETTYKASRIDAETYLLHISRYIHLNPRYWKRYPHSSLRYYLGHTSPEWLMTDRISELFSSVENYRQFHEGYTTQKEMIEDIKYQLADR